MSVLPLDANLLNSFYLTGGKLICDISHSLPFDLIYYYLTLYNFRSWIGVYGIPRSYCQYADQPIVGDSVFLNVAYDWSGHTGNQFH